MKPPPTPIQEINENLEFENKNLDPEIINEILSVSGVLNKTQELSEAKDANKQLQNAFKKVGADLDFVAERIKDIAARGESETARISAAKFIAEIHEVKTKLENEPTSRPNVTINIHEFSPNIEKKNLINFVMPKS
jgi:predicted transcriptional regulator